MACAIRPPSPVARICGRSTSFLALYIAIAAVHPVAAQDTKCPSARDCNAPMPYSELQSTKELPKIVASAGISDDVKAKLNHGHQAVVDFMGGVKPVNAYIFEQGGSDAAYEPMRSIFCDQTTDRYGNCQFDSQVQQAQNGGGQYFKGGGGMKCACSHFVETSAALYYLPSASDTAQTVAERAVHELCHAVQMKAGDNIPTWLMEGGAVQMECLLNKKLSWGTMSYSECLKGSGGRGVSTIQAFLDTYASSYGSENGLIKGSFMDCNGFVGASDKFETIKAGGLDPPQKLFYDTGAIAIAWAINKSGKTSKDFWTSKTEGTGFWNAIVPYDRYDYQKYGPDACPDGMGWKRAFCNFTGHGSMNAFYAEFDTWARTATEANVLAILESDTNVETMTATKFDVTSDDHLKDAKIFKPCGALPSPSPGQFIDNAPDGACCAAFYGVSNNENANACDQCHGMGNGFTCRDSHQQAGVDKTSKDCISFEYATEADCITASKTWISPDWNGIGCSRNDTQFLAKSHAHSLSMLSALIIAVLCFSL